MCWLVSALSINRLDLIMDVLQEHNVQTIGVNHVWVQGLDMVRCVQRYEVVFVSAFRRKLVWNARLLLQRWVYSC